MSVWLTMATRGELIGAQDVAHQACDVRAAVKWLVQALIFFVVDWNGLHPAGGGGAGHRPG
jgi:hypothetical protein